MLTVATTISDTLSEEEKKEIKSVAPVFDSLEIKKYVEKALGMEDIIKFIFEGFVLKNFIRDAVLWDSFKSLLEKLYNIAAKRRENHEEIQIWIQDTSNPAAIDIAFSFKNLEELNGLMVTLREKVITVVLKTEREKEEGKIFWFGYDQTKKEWVLKIL